MGSTGGRNGRHLSRGVAAHQNPPESAHHLPLIGRNPVLLLRVHLAHALDGLVERVAGGHVHHLLGLHSRLQARVVRLERGEVQFVGLEELLLDALRQHVLRDDSHDVARRRLLDGHPASRLRGGRV